MTITTMTTMTLMSRESITKRGSRLRAHGPILGLFVLLSLTLTWPLAPRILHPRPRRGPVGL